MDDWQGVVLAVLQGANAAPGADALALAWCCGLRLVPVVDGTARLDGARLLFNAALPLEQQALYVRREIARWALLWRGVAATPDALGFVASRLAS